MASGFLKNTIVLMTGSGLAQVFTLGITLLLARVYDDVDFGIMAIFAATQSGPDAPAVDSIMALRIQLVRYGLVQLKWRYYLKHKLGVLSRWRIKVFSKGLSGLFKK